MDIESGKIPVKMIYRDRLAERLKIAPKERLSLTLILTGRMIAVSALIDGGDLTSDQEKAFVKFLRETGAFDQILGVLPEKPITS